MKTRFLNQPWSINLVAFLLPFGLAIWQIITAEMGQLLVSPHLFSDAALFHYSAWFKSVFSEQSYVSEIIAFSPYESLLTAWLNLFAYSNSSPFILNAVLSGLSCLVITNISTQLFDPKTAWASLILYSFCTPILFFTGVTLKTGLVILLFACTVNLIVRYLRAPSIPILFAIVACILIASIDRIHVLSSAVILCGVMLMNARKPDERRKTLSHLLIFIGAFGVFKAWSDYHYGDEPAYVSNVGLNIYLGHSKPDNFLLNVAGVRNHFIGHRTDSKTVADIALGADLNQSQVSAYWLNKTLDYIKSNPADYLRHQRQKLHHLFANSASSANGEMPHLWQFKRWPLALAIVGFAAFYAFYVLGIYALHQQSRCNKSTVILITISLIYLASMMTTIVFERYRLSAIVVMLPIVSFGLVNCITVVKNSRLIGLLGIGIFSASYALAYTAPAEHIKNQDRLYQQEVGARTDKVTEHYQARAALDTTLNRATCTRFLRSLRAVRYQFDYERVRNKCRQLNGVEKSHGA